MYFPAAVIERSLDTDLRVHSGRVYYPAETLRYFLFEHVALFMAADHYLVAIYLMNSSNLSVARSGDKEWTVVEEDDLTMDIAFHDDGKLYSAGYTGWVKCWDFHKYEDLSLAKPEFLLNKRSKPNILVSVLFVQF